MAIRLLMDTILNPIMNQKLFFSKHLRYRWLMRFVAKEFTLNLIPMNSVAFPRKRTVRLVLQLMFLVAFVVGSIVVRGVS